MKCGHIDKYTQRFRWLGLRVTARSITECLAPPQVFLSLSDEGLGFIFSFIVVCFPSPSFYCSHTSWHNDITTRTVRINPWIAKKYVIMSEPLLVFKSRSKFHPIVFFIHFIRVDKHPIITIRNIFYGLVVFIYIYIHEEIHEKAFQWVDGWLQIRLVGYTAWSSWRDSKCYKIILGLFINIDRLSWNKSHTPRDSRESIKDIIQVSCIQ